MSTSETKVGALTLGGAVILAAMISFLGAFKLFDSGYDLHVSYPDGNAGIPYRTPYLQAVHRGIRHMQIITAVK